MVCDSPDFFQSFLKSAQYIARLNSEQDIWETIGKLLMTYFQVEWTAFIRREPGGNIALKHCILPETIDSRFLTSDQIRPLIDDVLESGFLASRVIFIPEPSMTAVIPVSEVQQGESVLLVGHSSAEPIKKERLDIYLAIAGLGGITWARLQNELEIKRHQAHLEELVRERTAELTEAKSRLELLLHSVGEGICGVDLEGRITFVNPSAAHLLGWDAGELTGRPAHSTFHYRHPDGCGYDVADCQILAVLRDGVVRRGANEEFLRRDGTVFPVDFIITPILREDNILGAVIAFSNITERRRAEQEIECLNERLKKRAAELEASNRELQSFCYTVSHDLRTPLRGMNGFSQALLEDYSDKVDEQGKKWLTGIRSASQMMGKLIDDILLLSGVVQRELRIERINLTEIARTIAEDLKTNGPGRNVEIRVMDNMETRGDFSLMRLALENLLGNAWKFTSKCDSALIEFSVTSMSPERVYFVRDTGAGFDMQYAGKLFKPFHRLHAETQFPGTGIGLATVQRVIRRHGGRIWAEAGVGKGATFFFTLEE